MHRDLGVGVAGQLHTRLLELLTQRREVLDDAVVHHRDLAGRVAMRMRIAVGGTTVGGPPGMPHPRGTGEVLLADLGELGLQIDQPPRLPLDGQTTLAVEDGDSRRVVTPVLHPPQRFHHDVESTTVPDIAHDSAHA